MLGGLENDTVSFLLLNASKSSVHIKRNSDYLHNRVRQCYALFPQIYYNIKRDNRRNSYNQIHSSDVYRNFYLIIT